MRAFPLIRRVTLLDQWYIHQSFYGRFPVVIMEIVGCSMIEKDKRDTTPAIEE